MNLRPHTMSSSLCFAVLCGMWLASRNPDVRAIPGIATSDVAMTLAEEIATPAPDVAASFVIASLPLHETSVSMQRIRYQPGAELAEQPIDGPKLIRALTGRLTIETAATGATAYHAPDWQASTPLDPGVALLVDETTLVLIPAGVPVNFSNHSDAAVEWLLVQIETPPTICACGQDLSLMQSEILDSSTLEQGILAPAALSLVRQRLEPGAAISEPAPDSVQLVGITAGNPAALARSQDGATSNVGNAPVEVFVVTIVS